MKTYPTFQEALDTVESLTIDEQTMLIEIIQNRLRQQQRQELIENVTQSEQDYAQGNFHRGPVEDLMIDLEENQNLKNLSPFTCSLPRPSNFDHFLRISFSNS